MRYLLALSLLLVACGGDDPLDPRAEEFATPELCQIIDEFEAGASALLAESYIIDAGEPLALAVSLSEDVVRACEADR